MESRGQVWALHGLKSLQIDREHYWQALCEVPAHYTPLQQSHGHLMVPTFHSWL